ncbi:hypothetical protein BZL41_26855 [Pseudomonas sp. PIC25]|nr:hypothetical protein BZL41_26855 [Pseudomonas sp. PIC25]
MGQLRRPRQEAERNRRVGGRAAWMSREARLARDGPSRRAPGTAMEGGNPGAAGRGRLVRMPGQALLVTFWGDCQK